MYIFTPNYEEFKKNICTSLLYIMWIYFLNDIFFTGWLNIELHIPVKMSFFDCQIITSWYLFNSDWQLLVTYFSSDFLSLNIAHFKPIISSVSLCHRFEAIWQFLTEKKPRIEKPITLIFPWYYCWYFYDYINIMKK